MVRGQDTLLRLLWNKKTDETDMFQLTLRHYGLSNRDKILYYICEESSDLGFFAMYRYWLEYLYFADICGYTPVIMVGKSFAYYDTMIDLELNNVFEYYFKQPSNIDVNEVKRSNKVIFSNVIHRQMVELVLTGKKSHYDCNINYLRLMSKMVNKYLVFNTKTETFINENIDKLQIAEKKILGIHIRGTDFRKKYDNHPIFVTKEEYFAAIESVFDNNNYEKIFLATDDQHILDAFILRYGKKLCYYSDVLRSNDSKSVAFSKSNRDNHKYKLGLEVIRDMYTLSKCDGLIAGISQVSICARINKLARMEKYEHLTIIDKGIYKNGHCFHR